MRMRIRVMCGIFSLCHMLLQNIFCTNLNGTAAIVYKNQNNVFYNGESALGYVRMNGGFTIVPGATATLDTMISVSGSIDLRNTGHLQLLTDLILDTGVSWSSGGYINGRGKSLILSGDLTIPASKVIHFSGNTIVNGNGHTINLLEHAQLFVENTATLTLRNVVIKNKRNSPFNSPIKCGGTGTIALDNVVLDLHSDFDFKQGQCFIHNDVVVRGTHGFIYRSPFSSYITSAGHLYFDVGTTFSYAPSSADNQLFVLQDKTSTLYFNGCSLNTTPTGMRLTKGRLIFDNKVSIQTNTGAESFSTLSTLTSVAVGDTSNVYRLEWSPNGNFIAAGVSSPGSGSGGFFDTNELRVWSFDGANLTAVASQDYGAGATIFSSVWSPDGQFIAIGGSSPGAVGGFANTDELRIYSFNGVTLTPVTSQDYGSIILFVDWSPDGKYVAISGLSPASGGGFANTNELRIYSFDGSTLTPITSQDYGSFIEAVHWSPDGQFLAVGGSGAGAVGGFANTHELRIYSFNGSTLTPVTSQGYGSVIGCVRWSPDGNYLGIGGNGATSGAGGFANTDELRMYSFNGSTLTPITSRPYGTRVLNIDWISEGTILAVGGQGPVSGGGFANTHELRLYEFNGSTLVPLTSKSWGSGYIDSTIWHPTSAILGIGGTGPVNPSGGFNNTDEIRLYTVNYTTTSSPQAISKGLIFGDSSQGSSHNVSVEILGGANVSINGFVMDDSI